MTMLDEQAENNAIIIHHDEDETYEGGFYIVFLDSDGRAFDAIGPFDTKDEAKQTLDHLGGRS